MRFILAVSALIAIPFSPLFSLPAWVKTAVEHSQNFAVSAEAAAVVLHHSEKVEISPDGNAFIIIQHAHKILNSDGLEYG
ncbi:MAG: hypothetical protein EHM72_11780, partial [Calditrichaeota bacterium]